MSDPAAKRIETGVVRHGRATITVDGNAVQAYPGESLAAALLVATGPAFRVTASGARRGPFCNMGVCFECLVSVDGEQGVRACMTPVRDGMRVETGANVGTG